MRFDSRPITPWQSSELGRFLGAYRLPALENTPIVQRMLLEDMRRYRAGKRTRYIVFFRWDRMVERKAL
jgi:hypothetical protein